MDSTAVHSPLCLCSQEGPCMASVQMGRWQQRRGHPEGRDCRLVLHKDAYGHSLRIQATLCFPHVLMFLTCRDSLSTCRALCLQRSVCGAICKSAKIDFMCQDGPVRAGALGPWGPADLRIIPYMPDPNSDAAGDSGILVPQKPAIPVRVVFLF